MVKTKCKQCGRQFKTTQYLLNIGKGRFCKKDCYSKYQIGKLFYTPKKYRYKKNCIVCKCEYIVKRCFLNQKFCSRKCYIKGSKMELCGTDGRFKKGVVPKNKARIYKTCQICYKNYSISPCYSSVNKVCSRGCLSIYISINFSGKNSYSWQGGRTSLRDKVRRYYKYKNWRNKVLARDFFTCQVCKARGGSLEVDHYPLSFALLLDFNNINSFDEVSKCDILWDLNNGRTLCKNCHKSTDTYLKPVSSHSINANGSALLKNYGYFNK